MTAKIAQFFSSKLAIAIIVVVVVLVGGGVIFSNEEDGVETFTTERGEFLQQVSVSGKVVAAESVDLAFSQTGRVSAVYADVGDGVSRGNVIAEIENGDVYAEVLQKQAAYEAAQADLAALESGTRSEQLAITESKLENAEVTLSQARETLLEEIQSAYADADDAIHNDIDQFFSSPRSSNPELELLTRTQSESQIEFERLVIEESLVAWSAELQSLTPQDDLIAAAASAQERLKRISSFLEVMAIVVSDLEPNGTLTQTTIDGYRTDVASARSSVTSARGALTTDVSSLKDAQAALTTAQRNLELERAGATAEDLAAQEAQVKAALADLEGARARYRKTLIVAPFSGLITRMEADVGGRASSNDSLISMISINTLQIESFVPEVNAPLIEVGDTATVTLDAYGEDVPFSATVISIDPAETIRDGVSTYRTTLQFNERDERVKPGMTANIVITTERKENVIAVPQGVVFQQNGEKVVYVKSGETAEARPVEVGTLSSGGTIEILSGLSEGEEVLLEEPSN